MISLGSRAYPHLVTDGQKMLDAWLSRVLSAQRRSSENTSNAPDRESARLWFLGLQKRAERIQFVREGKVRKTNWAFGSSLSLITDTRGMSRLRDAYIVSAKDFSAHYVLSAMDCSVASVTIYRLGMGAPFRKDPPVGVTLRSSCFSSPDPAQHGG